MNKIPALLFFFTLFSATLLSGCIGMSEVCGNGISEGSEECDDGNPDNTDYCTSGCKMVWCGDGFVWAGHEDCTNCPADCGECPPECGNGLCEEGEGCGSCEVDCGECPLVCPPSMVSYWRFEEGSGTVAEDLAGGNDGAINGPIRVSGKVGEALEFDGSSNYVDVSDDATLGLSANFTLEAWVYPKGYLPETAHVIVGKWQDTGEKRSYLMYVYYYSESWVRLTCAVSGDGSWNEANKVQGNINLPVDSWYHVACTHSDDGTLTIYLNGSRENATTGVASQLSQNNASLRIGNYECGYYFNGIIDETAIYNRVLPAEEIEEHYNEGNGKSLCE